MNICFDEYHLALIKSGLIEAAVNIKVNICNYIVPGG